MADTFYGEMREPLSREDAFSPGAPLTSPPLSRCDKCNSTELKRTYHRDLIACLLMHRRNERQTSDLRGGEHLHWQCRDCGYDLTSPCADDDE